MKRHGRPPRRLDHRRIRQRRRIRASLQAALRSFPQGSRLKQFELFQSVFDPDKFALLELWESQEALDNHAKLQAARPPLPEGLRQGSGEREDYQYKRTR